MCEGTEMSWGIRMQESWCNAKKNCSFVGSVFFSLINCAFEGLMRGTKYKHISLAPRVRWEESLVIMNYDLCLSHERKSWKHHSADFSNEYRESLRKTNPNEEVREETALQKLELLSRKEDRDGLSMSCRWKMTDCWKYMHGHHKTIFKGSWQVIAGNTRALCQQRTVALMCVFNSDQTKDGKPSN